MYIFLAFSGYFIYFRAYIYIFFQIRYVTLSNLKYYIKILLDYANMSLFNIHLIIYRTI